MEKRKPAARFQPFPWRFHHQSRLLHLAQRINPLPLPQLVVGCAQSVGMQRDHNEDAILTLTSLSANSDGYLPIGLFIIADGMGGHKHGEIASHLAVHTIAHRIMGKVMLPLLDSTPTSPGDPIQEILEGSVQEAHRVISKEAPGSGTTLTVILISGQQMSIAHVGDSRAYAVDLQGVMQVLTRDHSLVMRMLELGHLTEEEASIHPQRNVLISCAGPGRAVLTRYHHQPVARSRLPAPVHGWFMGCSAPGGNVPHYSDRAHTGKRLPATDRCRQ